MHPKLPQEERHHTSSCCATQPLHKRSQTSSQYSQVPSHCSTSNTRLELPEPTLEQDDKRSTLNMFRTSRNDTSKKAYQEIEGIFAWNATPLAPLGTRAIVFIHSEYRNSFAPHCDTGYVVGRTPHHYCLLEFYIPATRRYRRSGTYRLYSQHCRMPTISEADCTLETAADLVK